METKGGKESLKEKEIERGERAISQICWFNPQITARTGVKPDQSQEPRIPSESPTRVAGA